MAEWYDRLSDEQIAWLKSNRVQYRLLTPAEVTHLSEVPFEEIEWNDYGKWRVAENSRRYYNDTVYRLSPDWERPKKMKWVFDDKKICGSMLYAPGASQPSYWNDPELQRRDDYVGVIWEWRGYTWVEDGHAPTKSSSLPVRRRLGTLADMPIRRTTTSDCRAVSPGGGE